MEAIKEFIKVCKDYVSLMEKAEELTPYEFLSKCIILLPLIYHLGLSLPDIDLEEDDASGPRESDEERNKSNQIFFKMLEKISKKLGTNDAYNEIFDPIKENDVLVCYVSNDLSEIYQDLIGYITEYDSGKVEKYYKDTIWNWKFSMQIHTGRHITEALHPLHWLVYEYLNPDNLEETP